MSLIGLFEEIGDALRVLQDEIPELQICDYWNEEPTPPVVDVFPPPLFMEGAGFLAGNNLVHLIVRARVAMADTRAGQRLLLRLLDPEDPASVEVALSRADFVVGPEGVSGFSRYADDTSAVEPMLGVEWRVVRFL